MDRTAFWPWLFVVGMPLSLPAMFSLTWMALAPIRRRAALRDPRVVMALVDGNTVCWMMLAAWRLWVEGRQHVLDWKGWVEGLAFLGGVVGLLLLRALGNRFFPNIRMYEIPSTPGFAILTVVLGGGEELIWRGYVFTAFGGSWQGLVFSSIGFALYHLPSSPQHALYALAAGGLLGIIFWITGGALWGVVAAHALYNGWIMIQKLWTA